MKRNTFFIAILLALFMTVGFAGDLDKPSTNRGNIITGSEISDLYDAMTGDQVFDNVVFEAPSEVKVYRALLTQTSTDVPTALVFENTLGGVLVWSRDDFGIYIGTLAGAFDASKCFMNCETVWNGDEPAFLKNRMRVTGGGNEVTISAYDISSYTQKDWDVNDEENDYTGFVEILVYP